MVADVLTRGGKEVSLPTLKYKQRVVTNVLEKEVDNFVKHIELRGYDVLWVEENMNGFDWRICYQNNQRG